jgi:hypothetical protein
MRSSATESLTGSIWGDLGWQSWRDLEVEAEDLNFRDIYLVLRPGGEDPLDRAIAVQVVSPVETERLDPNGVAPILEAARRAVRSLRAHPET